jgi:hypothetical protein
MPRRTKQLRHIGKLAEAKCGRPSNSSDSTPTESGSDNDDQDYLILEDDCIQDDALDAAYVNSCTSLQKPQNNPTVYHE